MRKEVVVGSVVLGLMGACDSDSTSVQPSDSEAGMTGGQSAGDGSSGGASSLGGGAGSGGLNSGGTTRDASSASGGAGGSGGTDGSVGTGGAAGSGGLATGGRVSADAGTGATAGTGGADAGPGGFLVQVTIAGPGQGGVMDSFAIIDCGIELYANGTSWSFPSVPGIPRAA